MYSSFLVLQSKRWFKIWKGADSTNGKTWGEDLTLVSEGSQVS